MSDQPSNTQLTLFALPNFALSALFFPLVTILPNFYARYTEASLVAIGSVLLFTRLFDAVSDPLIGYLSDKTQSRWGRRKPWLAAGTLLLIVPAYRLFNPPPDAGADYYFIWSLLLYLGWTMIQIPYFAWSTELARGYQQRTRIAGYLALSGASGALVFIAAPLALGQFFGTTEYTPEVMGFLSTALLGLTLILVVTTLVKCDTGTQVATQQVSLSGMWQSVRHNKPFWVYAASFAAGGMGTGITLSVLVVYIDNYLQLAEKLPLILGAYSLSALAGVSLVVRLVKRIDKHHCWALCWLISAAVPPCYLLLEPGESAVLPMVAGSMVLGVASAGTMVLPIALLGDVIDYDILKTRVNRSANYFAFNALLTKSNVAIGGGLAFYLLAAFGYEVGRENDEVATNGLLFIALILPSLFSVAAAALLWFFPINRQRHASIIKQIEQRAANNPQ